MENSTPTEFRENDIFRWSFSPEWYEKAKQWRHDPYWCCSRFAIVKGSHLLDTYWLHDLAEQNWTTDGMKWDTRHQLIVELELIANLDDLEKVPEYCADYYDDSDIVDLNHSNNGSGCFYIRKGAQRSREKMLAVAHRRLKDQQDKYRWLEQDMRQTLDLITRISSTENLREIYL